MNFKDKKQHETFKQYIARKRADRKKDIGIGILLFVAMFIISWF